MISKKVQKALNDQVQAEFYSAYMYLAMSTSFAEQSLSGIAHWFKVQYEEENTHAHKIIDYIIERGGKVELKEIKAPGTDFGSPLAVFEKALSHEQHVTSLINKLYELAVEEKDYATQVFLQWFITEQVEEEDSVGEIVEQMKRIPENSAALFYFDQKLAARKDD